MGKAAGYVDCMIVSGGRKLAGKYTYALPVEFAGKVVRGSLVLVPARKKLRFAVALDFPETTEVENVKDVVAVYDGPPIVSEEQFAAAKWLGAYYVVPPVASMKPFLVELRALKVSEYIQPIDSARLRDKLDEKGLLFVHKETVGTLLAGSRIERRRFENFLMEGGIERASVEGMIASLIADGIVKREFVIEHKKGISRKETYIRFAEESKVDLEGLKDEERGIVEYIRNSSGPVEKKKLLESLPNIGKSLGRLKKKGFVKEFSDASLGYEPSDEPPPKELTADQTKALVEISGLMGKGEAATVLLHGVTGSGKTEVYVRAAAKAIEAGKSVIVLVPEIALTHQVVRRFVRDFPGRLAVLHSELSQAERVAEWERIHRGDADIVIGARSALFAPVGKLGLIILDEEHEPSYKQNAMPRYHARELARRMVSLHKAVLIVGSATPSLESYELARNGKFHLIELPERIMGGPLPEIELVKRRFVKVEIPGGKVVRRLEVITEKLREAIDDVLSRNKQALLFLNQRGFARTLVCPECGLTFLCPACHLLLVHHSKINALLCHHCAYKRAAPSKCSECGDVTLVGMGIGTQRLEAEIARLFPDHPLHRLDRDVSEIRGSQKVLDDFRSGKAQILLGTQMIAKGLDFPDVELVGVISAEDSLAIPDFRAAERTFQLLTQVAGRAGRREARGRVIVQGIRLDHYAVTCAVEYDYKCFFEKEREIRERFGYPPFKHLARIVVASKEYNRTAMAADIFGDELRSIIGTSRVVDILGPAPAPLERLKGVWRRHLVFKADKVGPISALLRKGLGRVKFPSDVVIEIDIDPLNMM